MLIFIILALEVIFLFLFFLKCIFEQNDARECVLAAWSTIL